MRFSDFVTGVLTRPNQNEIDLCDILLCRKDAHCTHQFRGSAYSPLIDSIGDEITAKGLSTSRIALPFSRLVGKESYGHPYNFHRKLLVELGKAKLKFFFGLGSRENRSLAVQKDIWRDILQRARPKAVIGIMPSESLCLAGHELGIPVLDLQHGVISDEHPWYGSKYRINSNADHLPNGYLVWDESSANVLTSWTKYKRISVEIIGNPWFRRFALQSNTDPVVQEALAHTHPFGQGKPTILYSMQHGRQAHYSSPSETRFLPLAVEEVIQATGAKYNWALRLHPVQARGYESTYVQKYLSAKFGHMPNVDWQRSSLLPLPALLTRISLHLTDASSIVIEAAWMGVLSGILNPDISPGRKFASYFSEERANGQASAVKLDCAAIGQWIEESLSVKTANPANLITDKLFDHFVDRLLDGTAFKV